MTIKTIEFFLCICVVIGAAMLLWLVWHVIGRDKWKK